MRQHACAIMPRFKGTTPEQQPCVMVSARVNTPVACQNISYRTLSVGRARDSETFLLRVPA